LISFVKYSVLVLGIILVVAGYTYVDSESPKRVSVNELTVQITTDKQVYYMGDEINATVWFINTSHKPVYIDPITSFHFSGNYVNDTNPVGGEVAIDYAFPSSKIIIPAEGKTAFWDHDFQAYEVGTFTINCFGASKSVDVEFAATVYIGG
jgi:hypothetical protein